MQAKVGKVGLVLEGGGMRGVYTAGVLDYFAERELYFPYQIGVSAGACIAISYISRQRGRNKVINIDYAGDKRYLSWRNFIRHRRELFGMDFIFREIPLELVPFDFQTFNDVPDLLVIGTTDVETAEAVYYAKGQPGFDLLTVLRASSSLPLLAPIVEFDGRKLMDGGISDPIPIRKAERDGYARNVLILTRNEGYVKSRSRMRWLLKRKFGEYPAFVDLLLNRHQLYNDTVAYIEKRAADGAAFIVRPSQPLTVGRLEQNRTKLEALYKQGYDDAAAIYPELIEWLG